MKRFTKPWASHFQKILCRHRASTTLLMALGAATGVFAQSAGSTPQSFAGTNAPSQLPDVLVTGTAEKPAGGNVVDATTLKLPQTLHETPRSVTVIDAEQIREQNFRTIVDTFYYTPGITPNAANAGGYHFISRGFRMSPDETRVDGFSGFYAGGGQSPQMLYGVERVVIQRGPAGLLYGAGSMPGGMINIITKKPEEAAFTRIDLTTLTYAGNGVDFGDRAGLGAEIDSTGPLTDHGRVLYRTIVAGDNSDHYTAEILNKTRYANVALTFKLDEEGRNRLTPLLQFSDNARPAGAGMVISPSSSLSLNDGGTRLRTGDLSPLEVKLWDGGRTDRMFIAGFDFQSKPVDPLTFNANYRFIQYETKINQWSPQVTTSAHISQLQNSGTVSRIQSKSEAERYSHNFDVNGIYEFEPADWFKNLVQVGFNGRQVHAQVWNATGPLGTRQSPINIHTGAADPVIDNSTGWASNPEDDDFFWNLYAQDQLGFLDEMFVLTLGLGYGQQHYSDAPTRKGDVTPNVALVYNPVRSLALYASYSTSYLPSDPTLENAQGNSGSFDPQTGVNYETGLKFDLPNDRASIASAFFWTERDNVLAQSAADDLNPNGNRYYTEQGGQSAHGIEVESWYQFLPNWDLRGTFTWTDASYETGPFPKPVAKTPEFSWSLFTRYEITHGPLKRLAGNLGLVWNDERMGGNAARSTSTPDPVTYPAFYRVDAGLSYRFNKHADIALNVQNLFDERIIVDGTRGANLQIAAPRTFSLRIGYTF